MQRRKIAIFEVLGVRPEDDLATIKAAWRKKVKQLHPDVAADKAAAGAQLAEINAAYGQLGTHMPFADRRRARRGKSQPTHKRREEARAQAAADHAHAIKAQRRAAAEAAARQRAQDQARKEAAQRAARQARQTRSKAQRDVIVASLQGYAAARRAFGG